MSAFERITEIGELSSFGQKCLESLCVNCDIAHRYRIRWLASMKHEAAGLKYTHLLAFFCPPFDSPRASFAGLYQLRAVWPIRPSETA